MTNKVSLMRRICSKRLADGGDMERHIRELTDLFQRSADLGQTMVDTQKVGILLSSLTP